MHRLTLAFTALVATTVIASPASASTISYANGIVSLVDGQTEDNAVTMTVERGGDVLFHDTHVAAGAGCALEGAVFFTYVRCPGAGAARFVLSLGDGKDKLIVDTSASRAHQGPESIAVDGGPGDDQLDLTKSSSTSTISGGPGDDVLRGGGGNDTLRGGPGSDAEYGNDGGDVFDQDAAANGGDVLDGGADVGIGFLAGPGGGDRVVYSLRSSAVVVTAGDGAKNDGVTGEGDDVRNVEVLLGGSADDHLVLDDAPATYPDECFGQRRAEGGAGNDVLQGGRHADSLDGGAGDDRLDGGGGSDCASGGAGNDTLDGGPDNDSLDGDDGDDRLRGGTGGDWMTPGAGRDDVSGGSGHDSVAYWDRVVPLTLSLNGVADDGEPGEGDQLWDDIEQLTGGWGDDRLSGDSNANHLFGGAGKDTIVGNGGTDLLDGGPGDDLVQSRDEVRDTVACGGGNDTAEVDSVDVDDECEATPRTPAPEVPRVDPDPKPDPQPDKAAPTFTLTCGKPRITRAKLLRGLACAAKTNEPATLRYELRLAVRKARVVAATRYNLILSERTLLPGQRASATLRAPRTLLPAQGAFKVEVRVTATDPSGNAAVKTMTVQVTRR